MDDPATYRYESYSFKIITPLIVLISLTFLFNGALITGFILMLIAFLSAISFRGVIIDRENQKYMKYDRFLQVRIGKWETLSKPSYVTVVRINLSDRRTGPAPLVMPEDKKGAKAYKVNLVVEGDERYVPICRGPLEKMTREALRLGEHLHIRVLDYSTHEKKWIL